MAQPFYHILYLGNEARAPWIYCPDGSLAGRKSSRRISTIPPDADVDRCASMLFGPLFPSADYPWPRAGDRWLEPVLQIDLAWLGAAGGLALDAGLVQVWTRDRTALVRIVPVASVRRAALASVPPPDPSTWHRPTCAVGVD